MATTLQVPTLEAKPGFRPAKDMSRGETVLAKALTELGKTQTHDVTLTKENGHLQDSEGNKWEIFEVKCSVGEGDEAKSESEIAAYPVVSNMKDAERVYKSAQKIFEALTSELKSAIYVPLYQSIKAGLEGPEKKLLAVAKRMHKHASTLGKSTTVEAVLAMLRKSPGIAEMYGVESDETE